MNKVPEISNNSKRVGEGKQHEEIDLEYLKQEVYGKIS